MWHAAGQDAEGLGVGVAEGVAAEVGVGDGFAGEGVGVGVRSTQWSGLLSTASPHTDSPAQPWSR
jgi:hypothetical protein